MSWAFQRHHLQQPESLIALLDAVRKGAGIAFQPCWMVNDLLKCKELVRILPQWTGPAPTAHLVYARRRRQPKRIEVVIELVTREIQAL